MLNNEDLPLKEKFLKIYANLPVGVREEIITTIDNIGPITWNSAYIEVEAGTDIGEKILTELEESEII